MIAGLWIRNRALSRVWCAMATVSDSRATTWCDARIAVSDAFHFDVEGKPPHDDRCSACVRVLIERRRIELGLVELTGNATFAERITRAVGADPDLAMRLATACEVAPAVIAQWANGTAAPHPRLQRQVLEELQLPRPAARPFEMFDYSDVEIGDGLE